MSARTAPVWDPAAVYGPDWERLGVVASDADVRCSYLFEWHPNTPERRFYRRTAAEHLPKHAGVVLTPAGGFDLYVCERCGKEI